MPKIPVIFDTDPGIDDAVALMLALFSQELDVKLITTVAGNVGIDSVTNNALKLLEFYGKVVPVAKGASCPIKRELSDAAWVHGVNGLGNYEFPNPKTVTLEKDALEAMHDLLLKSDEPITILSTAPLTNIATLLLTYPELKPKIKEIVFMGGSLDGTGNKTPYAEFNIGVDPEAADIVFQSGLNIVMCPMEMGHTAYLDKKDIDTMRVINYIGAMFEFLFKTYHDSHVLKGAATHDGCTVAYLIEPKMFKIKRGFISVVLDDTVKTGIVICDFSRRAKSKYNMNVCTKINVRKFKKLFFDILSNVD